MAKVVNRLGELVKQEQEKLSNELGRNVPQVEVAVLIGVDPTTLNRYIKGRPDSINWSVWKRLVDYFKVEGSEIFNILIDEGNEEE